MKYLDRLDQPAAACGALRDVTQESRVQEEWDGTAVPLGTVPVSGSVFGLDVDEALLQATV